MPTPPAEGRFAPAAAWVRAHLALLVLLALPLAVLGLPTLVGRAFLDGDNFIQNFPLRVLVGRDLAHGSLPLWNPYLFSGTPLLAGFNAGAAFPVTWLMAVLPVFVAWALGVAAAYDLALLGMYLFLRRQGMARAAATFGAATFTFAGYMTAQMVHVDLIQGAAFVPWGLLAVHGLTERAEAGPAGSGVWHRLWGGVLRSRGDIALLVGALGLAGLTGGVEAAIDGGVLLLIYWIGRLVSLGLLARRRVWPLVTAAVTFVLGVGGGVALGAAQWIPGGAFVAQSQRSALSYDFFTSGSLPDRLVTLLVSPFVLGTNQDRPAYYAGPYNFQEVTGYVGVLALIAFCVLPVRRFRRHPESRHWWVWYVVIAFGLLSALGNQTPFGRVLYLVPGLNSERLLNRNLLLVDCGLAVLLAWWTHLLLTDRPPGPPRAVVRHRWRRGQRAELVATLAPVTVSALLSLLLWVADPTLGRFLEATYQFGSVARYQLAGLVTLGTLIAAAATAIALTEARWSARTLRNLLAAVLTVDLLLFNLFVLRPPVTEASAQARGPTAAAFRAAVGDGRFVIFDPDRFAGDQLLALGQTDLNIFTGTLSAQGYTALADGRYYQATGAHLQEDLAPATLAGPVWDSLNVTTLVSVPSYFVTPAPGAPTTGYPYPGDVGTQPTADGPFPLARGASRRWYFGGPLTLQQWSVPIERGAPRALRVGLLTTTGQVQWVPASEVRASGRGRQRHLAVDLPAPVQAGGVVVQATGGTRLQVGAPTAVTVEAGTVRLDGRMQDPLTGSRWVFSGTLGSFGVFHNTSARGWAWLEGPGGGPVPAGSTVTAGPPEVAGDPPVVVHATGRLLLQRSETWGTGWRAEITSAGPAAGPAGGAHGSTVAAPVTRAGLVQQVALPGPGDYRITFTYAPGSVRTGIAVSAAAAGILLLWGGAELVGWRRRRRAGPGHRPPALNPG